MNSLQNPCWLMIEGDYIIKCYQTYFFDVRHKLYTGMRGFRIFSQSGVHVKSCEATTKPQVVGRFHELPHYPPVLPTICGFDHEGNSLRWFYHIQYQFRAIQFYIRLIYIYIFFHHFTLMFFGRATAYVLRSWRSCNGSTPSTRRFSRVFQSLPVGVSGVSGSQIGYEWIHRGFWKFDPRSQRWIHWLNTKMYSG